MKKQKILLYYRLFICFVAVFVISKFTHLGDYQRYINGNPIYIYHKYGMKFLINSTGLTEFIVGCVRICCLNNKLITNIVFNILTTYGIVYFLDIVKWNKIIFILILMPSFTIWSSYPSKEIFCVIGVSFILGNIIKKLKNIYLTKRDKIFFILGIYLVFVYKKQYLICIGFLLIYIYLRKKIGKNFRYLIYIFYVILVAVVAYLTRDYIDIFFKNFRIHFDYGSKETVRNLYMFTEKYGFFKYAFYGMFIAFFGPSLREIFQGGLKLFSFVESTIIIGIIIWAIIKSRVKDVERLFLFFNGLFLLLLPQYPFAIFNSGSAIRYRTNLYILVLGLLYIFILQNPKLRYKKAVYSKKITNIEDNERKL